MSFNHDGGSLLVSLASNKVLLGRPREGATRILDRGREYDPHRLQASHDGRWVASLSLDGRVRLWDAEEGEERRQPIVPGPGRGLPALAVGAGGRRVVLVHPPREAGGGALLEVWDYTRGEAPWQTPPLGGQSFNTAVLSGDGRSIVVGTWPEPRAVVIDTETGDILLDRRVAGDVYVSLFSPDRRRLFVLTANGWRYGWDLASGAELWPPRRESGLIRPAALSPDGEWIVAGHNNGLLRVYATATGDLVRELPHDGRPTVLYFVPDGSGRFVSAATNREAHLWQVETGEKLVSYAGHRRPISAGAFSDDGRWLATGTHHGDVLVHAVDSGQRRGARPIQHLGDVPTMDFQPGSDLLAVGSRDGVVRLWDTRSQQPASPPLEQGASILTVRFTADGRRLLVIDHFGFRFRDAATGLPVSVHYPGPEPSGTGMDSPSYHAFLTPDGSRVLRNDHRDVFNLWSVPTPPGPGEAAAVPAWFPDLLELLAGKRFGSSGEPEPRPAYDLPALRNELETADPASTDPYRRWARRILRIEEPQ
jgi:WD40 repeat protein